MVRPADLDTTEKIGLWYYGKTRTGKTRAATTEFPDSYRKCANNKWWDGYQGEESVIIDDIDKKHDYMGYHLKIWVDRYAFIAETKGSSLTIRPLKIIVTSNYHPRDIWEDETTLEPILARFKVVKFQTPLESANINIDDEEIRPHYSSTAPNFSIPNPITHQCDTSEENYQLDLSNFGDIL